MKKIIVVHLIPLLKRLKDGYLVNAYLEAGFELEYWDLGPFYKPSVKFSDELNEPYVIKFNNLDEVEQRLREIDKKQAVFFVQFHEIWYYRHLYRMLARHNCYMARININPPEFQPSLREVNFRGFFYHVLRWGVAQTYLYYKKLHNYKTYSHYFGVSDTSINSINQRYYGVKINEPDYEVSINRPDYENYLSLKDDPHRILEGKYILFVDPFFPCHPEDVGLSKENPVAKAYRIRMRSFFDWVEKRFQMPIVIAAHPSAIYEDNELGNRNLIKYKTAELVKDAEMVLLHQSNSNVFAILFDKPVVFLTTKELNRYPHLANKISGMAGFFNKKVYDLDQCSYENIEFSKVEPSLRKKYMYTYVTTPQTENRWNKDIVIEEFNRIFKLLEAC